MNGQDGLGQPGPRGGQAPPLLRPRRHQNQSHRNPTRHFREPINAIGHAGPMLRINSTTATVIPRNRYALPQALVVTRKSVNQNHTKVWPIPSSDCPGSALLL